MSMNIKGPGKKDPQDKEPTGDSRSVDAQLRGRGQIEGPATDRIGGPMKKTATIQIHDSQGNYKFSISCEEGKKVGFSVDGKHVTIQVLEVYSQNEILLMTAMSEKEKALAVLLRHLEHLKDLLEYGFVMNGVTWRGDDRAQAKRIKEYDLDAKDINDAIAKADKKDSKVISILEQLVKMDPSNQAAAKKALEKASQGKEKIEAETVLEALLNNIPSAPIPSSYPSNSETVIAAIAKVARSDSYVRDLLNMIVDLERQGLKSDIVSAAKKALEGKQ